MTDGIIQEIFNQFRAKRLGHSITHSETLTLERELIEKIKQHKESTFISYYENMLYKWLIGDDQE